MATDASALLDASIIQEPNEFYAELRTRSPVWKVPGVEAALVTSWELVTEATSRVDEFSNHLDHLLIRGDDGAPTRHAMAERGDAIHTLATADPPVHTIHRSVVFPELVAQRMADMEDDVRAFAGPLVEAAVERRRVDWTTAVANPLPMRVLSKVLGFTDPDLQRLLDWAFAGTELLAGTRDRHRIAELDQIANEAGLALAGELLGAFEDPGDDLLGAVARGVVDEQISIEEGVATLTILLGAGGETTTSLTGNAVRMLADNPDIQDRLRAEPHLIADFLEEVLRLETPFRFHYRTTTRDVGLGEVELAAGTTVLLCWGAANRDPAEFDDADQLRLDRHLPRHHLGFGRGIHFCVGAPLARLEARLAIEALLGQTSHVGLDPDSPPRWVDSIFVRRHERLPVVLEP